MLKNKIYFFSVLWGNNKAEKKTVLVLEEINYSNLFTEIRY